LDVIEVIRTNLDVLAAVFADQGRNFGAIFPAAADDERNFRESLDQFLSFNFYAPFPSQN
jgi:hypothetical protein